MSVTADQIKNAITGFWTSDDRIKPLEGGLYLQTNDRPLIPDAFSWQPRSVDPTKDVRYGFAIGQIRQEPPDNHWLVPLFFGLRGQNYLSPFVSLPLFLDGKGNILRGTSPTLTSSQQEGTPLELPEEIFFAPALVNAALLIFFFASQIGEVIARLSRDKQAQELALAPVSGLIMNQAVSAARTAIQLGDNPDALGGVVAGLRSVWPSYDERIKRWPLGRDWPDKGGNAKDFNDDNVRVWRASVAVDQDIWAIQTKFDLIRSVALDDHLIIAAAGRRTSDGSLKLLSISTSARFHELPDKQFIIKPGKEVDRADVFSVWADTLRGNVISLPEDKQKLVEQVIRRMGNKTGDKAGEDLLTWVAGAETA